MWLRLPHAASDYHFHRRDTNFRHDDTDLGTPRWSDKNGGAYTRCCWPDPAIKDQEDAGSNGIDPDDYARLRQGFMIEVIIAAEACTRPDNYLYSKPTHLMTAEWGGTAGHNHNCAAA